MPKARVTFRVMKLGRYVTVDDGGNYVTERSHKELGPPVLIKAEMDKKKAKDQKWLKHISMAKIEFTGKSLQNTSKTLF